MILGIYLFCLFVFIVIGIFVLIYRDAKGLLARIDKKHGTPVSVEQTVNQLYGDVFVEGAEGSKYMKSRHPISRHKMGG